MKTISTLLFTLISLISVAQTNIIRAKSHSSSMDVAMSENDNFGLPNYTIRIDSVILLNDKCLIEVSVVDDQMRYRDTICNHPYLQGMGTNLDQIKKHYGPNTKFEGFKESKLPKKIDQSNRFNNSTTLIGICFLIALLFWHFSFV